ncbi:hypothetical protein D9613_008456 [Agrocybe pediades]|uniref:Uncharacterized protein n=1 Tax=Agrocybe pediades TaxID=84607 RepID=A0A8H4VNE6_9AGAR|nr:hypothetical protein D9613_008456 [Agrocybe pediades]
MPPKAKPTSEHAQKRYTLASLKRFAELGMKGSVEWKGHPGINNEGYPPVKRGKGSSEYNPAKWGTPEFPVNDNTVCMKKDVSKIFCLNADDIVDLCYRKRAVKFSDHGEHIAHDYLASELERRAWEKFGGPEGLRIARQKRDQRVARTKVTKKGLDKNDPANVQPESTVYYKKYIPEPQSPGGDVRIISIKDKPPMVLCVGTRPPPSTPRRRNTLNWDYDNYEPDSDESDYYAEGGACDMRHEQFLGYLAYLNSAQYVEDAKGRSKQHSEPSTPNTSTRSIQNRTPGVTPNNPPPSSSLASVYTKKSEQKRRGVKRTHESSEEEDEEDDAVIVESDSNDSVAVPTLTPSQREVPKTPIRDLTRRDKEKERRTSQAVATTPYSTPPTTSSRQVSSVSSSRRAKQNLESNKDEDHVVVYSQRSFTPTTTPSKREAPKTPIRDLTRSGKERERQARQAAAASKSYSASPSTAASRDTPGSSLVTGGSNTRSAKRRPINSLVDSIVNDMPVTPTRSKKMRRD